MIYLALSPIPPGLLYHLSRNLYVSLTNTAIGLPLITSRGPNFKMPESSEFTYLTDNSTPTSSEIISSVNMLWESDEFEKTSLTFAGAGDPLLQLPTLLETVKGLKETNPDKNISFRVNTNGLFSNPTSICSQLKSNEINSISVALNYDNENDYNKHMLPPPPLNFETVCEFIRTFVDEEFKVTITCVDNGLCKVEKVREFAKEMGVNEFKVRSYFP